MLKVALFITDLEPGGAEKNVVELAIRADRSRFQLTVYCLGMPPCRSRMLDKLRAAQIPVEFLFARRWSDTPRVLIAAYKALRRQPPMIVHSFLFHANMIARCAARLAGVPGVLCGLRVAERDAPVRLQLERWTARWVDAWTCVSSDVASFAEKQIGLPRERLIVIPNGVEIPPDREQSVTIASVVPPGKRYALYLGRLERQKAVDRLIESAALWLPEAPDCDLVVAGDGTERAAIEQQTRRLGLASRVHFLGYRDDSEHLISGAALLVHAARWEGMANSVLEAMAAGKPVVAADVEGMREILGPESDAQTFPFGDCKAMADRVLRLLGTPSLALEIGQRNRRRAATQFSYTSMVAGYENLWGRVAAGEFRRD